MREAMAEIVLARFFEDEAMADFGRTNLLGPTNQRQIKWVKNSPRPMSLVWAVKGPHV